MNEHEITATAWHEAGHHLAAIHFNIPSWPEVTPNAPDRCGACHLDPEVLRTPLQTCVIAWAGIMAQTFGGFRERWMPPFNPTAEDLESWHNMMLFQREKLSKTDREMILGCYDQSWPACGTAHGILMRKMPLLKLVAGHLADSVSGNPAKKTTVAAAGESRTPIASRANALESHLARLAPDHPDRANYTEALAYMKRGEEAPPHLIAPPGTDSTKTNPEEPPKG